MFNGLDELEEFAEQLAPLTPEEAAAWEKRKAAAAVKRTKRDAIPDNTVDVAPVQEVAPQLGTIPEPVSEMASEPELPRVQAGLPEPAPALEPAPELIPKEEPTPPTPQPAPPGAPTSEGESGPASKAEPVQQAIAEIETVLQPEVSAPQPVLAAQTDAAPVSEPAPATRSRPYAGYIVAGGLLLLGLAALLL